MKENGICRKIIMRDEATTMKTPPSSPPLLLFLLKPVSELSDETKIHFMKDVTRDHNRGAHKPKFTLKLIKSGCTTIIHKRVYYISAVDQSQMG